MQTKTLLLAALSATAVLAGPHRRHYPHRHGSGRGGASASRTGGLFPAGNDTAVGPTGTGRRSFTVLPTASSGNSDIPATFGNVASGDDSTTTCISTSTATATSTEFVTVTAIGASASEPSSTKVEPVFESTDSVSAGQFYGSRTGWNGGSWGNSASSAVATSFMTVPSASMSGSSGPSAASSSSGSSSTGSGSAPSLSGGKRGISFNDASLVSAFGSSVSWAYNWAATESGNLGNIEYVPQLWGLNSVSGFSAGSAKAVLSFNEPDLSSQANIDPVTAASKHKQVFASMKGKVRIGSPAITNGDSTSPAMGIPWLNQFFSSCGSDCPVDFVAFHWYAGANNIAYFKQHVNDVIAAAAAHGINKVWLTEFAPDSGSDADKATFFKQAVEFLDSTSAVERYAAFMASSDTLLSGKALNSLGSAYAS